MTLGNGTGVTYTNGTDLGKQGDNRTSSLKLGQR